MSMMFGIGMSTWAADCDVISLVTANSVSKNSTKVTFTITRKETSDSTIVYYRTMDGSAISGIHYKNKSGSVKIPAGKTSENVVVELISAKGIDAYGKTRDFSLMAWNEFGGKYCDVSIKYDNEFTLSDTTIALNDQLTTSLDTTSSDPSDWYAVNDDHTEKVASSLIKVKTAEETYYKAIDYIPQKYKFKIHFKLLQELNAYFYLCVSDQKEHNDCYSCHDGNAKLGDNLFSTSFESSYVSGYLTDNPAKLCKRYVPIDYPSNMDEGKHVTGHHFVNSSNETIDVDLIQHKSFVATDALSSDGEYFLMPLKKNGKTSNVIYSSWDADGKDDDHGRITNAKIYVSYYDNVAPTLENLYCCSGTDNIYFEGDTFTLSLKFNELVNVSTDATIVTNIGTLKYKGGNGTNVLYFRGVLDGGSDVKGLKITSVTSMDVVDLSGNKCLQKDFKDKGVEDVCYVRSTLKNLKVSKYDIMNGTLTLEWNSELGTNANGSWSVFRRKASDDPSMSSSWIAVTENLSNTYYADKVDTKSGSSLLYDTQYVYAVQYVPSGFPEGVVYKTAKRVVNANLSTSNFILKVTATANANSVDLSWSSTPQLYGDYTYEVQRTIKEKNKYEKLQSGILNTEYTDNKVPNSCNVYTYKVITSPLFKDYKNQEGIKKEGTADAKIIEKTEFSGGLTVKSDTKEEAVVLSWKVNQIGIDPTTFEIMRDAELIATIKDSKSSYEYKDDKIVIGKDYKYDVKLIRCDKSSTNISESGKYKATGTIYGKVTYSSGGTPVSGVTIAVSKDVNGKYEFVDSVKTDSKGSYKLEVEYVGSGSDFIIEPSFGTHKFNYVHDGLTAATGSCMLSKDIRSAEVNFQDNSSFKFYGKVTYYNTECPVDSVNIYVGKIFENQYIEASEIDTTGNYVLTDKDGNFEISLGNGEHWVVVKKEGHIFSQGRWPTTGVKYIDKEQGSKTNPISFIDSTFVTLTGRVAGGTIQKEKEHGMGAGKANIGTGTIVLESGYNMCLSGEREFTTVLKSPKTSSKVIAREGQKGITITTDSVTGEFAVQVPPLFYKVASVASEGVPTGLEIPESVDLKSKKLQTKTDTLVSGKDTTTFEYLYALDVIHRIEQPSFDVIPLNSDHAFGDNIYVYKDKATGDIDTIQLYKKDGDSIAYYFNYPVFTQMSSYSYTIHAYEKYDNGKNVYDTVPLAGAVVTISNDLGATQVCNDPGETEHYTGEIIESGASQLTLDSMGMAKYKFKATFPNITGDHLLGMNIVYTYEEKEKGWSENGKFKGIVLGGFSSGKNFVTGGPIVVSYVLRDPPGSESTATLSQGSVLADVFSRTNSLITEESVSVTFNLGMTGETATGYGVLVINEINSVDDYTVAEEGSYTLDEGMTYTTTTTTNVDISTPEDLVGAEGDVFIGTGSNYIFGTSTMVDIHRSVEKMDSFYVDVAEAVSIGQQHATSFHYTQKDIVEDIMPQLESMRNGFLRTVDSASYDTTYKNISSEPIYITTLKEGDYGFGSNNTDSTVWGDKTSASEMVGPSYIMIVPDHENCYSDTIVWFNNQINTWKNELRKNEEAKVKTMLEKTPVSQTISPYVPYSWSREICHDTVNISTHNVEVCVSVGNSLGYHFNGLGMLTEVSLKEGYHHEESRETDISSCTNVSYVLAGDKMDVDVYEDPTDEYGPVFFLKAGETDCPYEDEERTKYFEPDVHVLSEKTMQIEKPGIEVENPFATNVPCGTPANFVLTLKNESETHDAVEYALSVDVTSNPSMAVKIDNNEVDRVIELEDSEEKKINLQISQTRLDVMKFDSIPVTLSSVCQSGLSQTVYLSVSFVPSCSPISLSLDNHVMNMDTHDTVHLTVYDYNKDFLNFKGVSVQYKGERETSWNRAVYFDAADLQKSYSQSASFPMSTPLFKDQTYLFRAVSECESGEGLIVRESEPIEMIKDMSQPLVLGNPNPSDGVLEAGDEIGVTFNEDIRSSYLDNKNFIVQGVKNDAQVDHDVALKMDGSSYAAYTESNLNLTKKSFSMDMWVNLSSGGDLISIDPNGDPLIVSVNENGTLSVEIEGEKITSVEKIPFDKWCFLTISLNANYPYISALVAYGDVEKQLFDKKEVKNTYLGSGKLYVGKNITGAISELSLWNIGRTNTEAHSQMYSVKTASTENLIGYWKFDEGHGLVANDLARNRNMNLASETWYLNNENYAAHLNGDNKLMTNISTCPISSSSNYMVEMWFRGEQQQKATLWSADTTLALKFNASGYLTLLSNALENQLSTNNYLDGAWHHVALNVLRNGMTTVYVDGVAVKQISSEDIPTLRASYLTIGAQSYYDDTVNEFKYTDNFKGDVDEIRYWIATFNAKTIDEFRYVRLNGDEAGLMVYCPFETLEKDSYGQSSSVYSLNELCQNKKVEGDAVQANTTPSLRPKKQLSDISYSFASSERTISISLNESPKLLEGTTVYFTVQDVLDENNNKSNVITWSAYINQNRLVWSDEEIAIEKDAETSSSFEVSVVNQGAATESWSISGLPSWLSASKSSGSLAAKKNEKISFEISDATPVGTYEESIYLTGNDEISVPLTLIVKVTANKPNWIVDPSQYKNSMSVLAQLKVDGKYSSDEDDMVAAFINGVCVGVASPVYYPRYDAYFVSLGVYGNDAEVNKNITFKAWDASTGVIYPSLSTSTPISFEANKVFGSMTKPILFETKDLQEQMFDLRKGWNWISLNVKPEDENINEVFNSVADETNLLKSKLQVAYSDEDSLVGTLETAEVGVMYKINMDKDAVLNLIGSPIDPAKDSVSVKTGWNWIGFNSVSNMSLGAAFADLSPVDGDMVKSQTAFAMYEDFEWVGTLTSLTPGKGYMYKSAANKDRSFTYPAKVASLKMAPMKAAPKKTLYTPVDETVYSGNMTIAAVVKENGEIIPNAQVGVFDANGVCRGAGATGYKSTVFLVVLGESSKDALTFKVMVNGFEYTVDQALSFEEDANYGTLQDPYVIDLGSGEITKLDFENDNLTSVSVCPTFVETELNVKSQTAEIENYTINDITGKLIMNVDVNSSDFTINVSDLSQGVYLINLKTSMGIVVKQFTKK